MGTSPAVRSRRQQLMTAVIVLLLGGVLPRAAASGLQAQAAGCTDDPLGKTLDSTRDPHPGMRAQQRQVEAADRILKLANDKTMTGLGGTWIEDDGKTVRLYWKGSVPEEMERVVAQVRADGISVDIVAARYSAAELMAEAGRIASLKPAEVDGVEVTGAGPRNDYSGLDVRISRAEDLSKARLRITSNVPLSLTVRRQAVDAASRHRMTFGEGCLSSQ